MVYEHKMPNGKVVKIPQKTLDSYMKNLDLTLEDAIQTYLEDEGYMENEEQENLCQIAKDNRITATIHGAGQGVKKKQSKPRTVKTSNEKQSLFTELYDFLKENHENVEILNQNKLIRVQIGDLFFKIDLIEQRKAKK